MLRNMITRSFSILAAAIFGLAGCGARDCAVCDAIGENWTDDPAAEGQEHGKLKLPEYPTSGDNPLKLTGSEGKYHFVSSLLLWNPDVTPEGVRAVSDATVGRRVATAKLLTFRRDQVLPLEQRKAENTEALKGLSGEYAHWRKTNPEAIETLREVSYEWFDSRLEELRKSKTISAEDETHARQMFEAYCEYKIWELALAPVILERFTRRPTPHVFCEKLYAESEREYFKGQSCAPNRQGKDYLECLWREGVMKTRLFEGNYVSECERARTAPADLQYATQKEAIETWVEDGFVRELLVAAYAAAQEAPEMAEAKEVLRLVMSRGKAAPRLQRAIPRVGACWNAFFVERTPERWETQSLDVLKQIVESEPGNLGNRTLSLLPIKPGVDVEQRWRLVSEPVYVFGERESGKDGINDGIFNLPVGSSGLIDDKRLERAAKIPALDVIVNARPDWLIEKERKLRDEARRLADQEAEIKAEQKRLEEERGSFLKASGEAVTREGVALAVLPFELVLERSGKTVSVWLRLLDDAQKPAALGLAGCHDLEAGNAIDCEVKDAQRARLDVDPESGRLTVRATMADPEGLGFKTIERRGPTFNDLAPEALAGRDLELTLDVSELDGVLRFFSGDAKILAGERPEVQGSLSGDNFSQALTEVP